jgi:hypothetical protein
VTKSYNYNLDKRDDGNNGKYAYYAFSVETYLCIAEYYKDNPNEGGVRIFMPDDDCDSEDPGDEWEYEGTGKAGAKAVAAEAEKSKAEAAARAVARRFGISGDRVMGGEDAMMGAMMGPLHWNMVSLLASLPG